MKALVKKVLPEPAIAVLRRCKESLGPTSPVRHLPPGVLNCTTAYNVHGGYCVPKSSAHRPAAKTILAGRVREPETIAFILANCGTHDVVHAGAFFGDFLPALSAGVAPGAKILAFEPNIENFRCAKITAEMNQISNVHLTNAGLGARQDRLLLRVRDDAGRALGGTSRIVLTGEASQTQSVEMMTVDQLVGERRVSVLQLDVEGHEQDALTGALGTLRRFRPVILLEVVPGSTLLESDWFASTILAMGYRKAAKVHENWAFLPAS
jgi:FkbM family methyltransferase